VCSSDLIYNYDRLAQEALFIFEGVFDAISLRPPQFGTALLSSDLSRDQAIRIFEKAPFKIIFVPDNDDTGRKTLSKNIQFLLRFRPSSLETEIFTYEIKGAKDFNETGRYDIELKECKKWNPKDISKISRFKTKEIL
jgi:hypothetical protein